jgi:hypothetical protein
MTLDGIKDRLAEGEKKQKKIGDILWWGTRGVDVAQEDVERLVGRVAYRFNLKDDQGKALDPKKICPQLQARGAVRKSLAELGVRSNSKKGKGQNQSGRILFTRRLDAEDDESLAAGDFSIVILEETYAPRAIGKGVRTIHTEVQRIRYDSKAKRIGLETDLFEQEIKAGFRKYGLTYTGTEIARVLGSLIELGQGFMLRESGGVYLVPASHSNLVEAAKEIANAIPGADLTRWPCLDFEGGEQKEQAKEMAGVAIRRELVKLQADLSDIKSRVGEPSLRASTITRRIQAVKVLKSRVQTYREILGLEDAKLKAGLNACLIAAKEIMDANVQAKELAKEGNVSRAA